ncbi:MAG: PD-(D/E)XK nuclease family protein, partial [Holophaga sp.]|nr:PD-(D/E)XK nuclease family protein [Holophaga sp.]
WAWEGHPADPAAEARAEAAQVRNEADALAAQAPPADRVPGCRAAWLKGQDSVSPTALEALARCPFRSMAERVWGMASSDPGGALRMAVGTLAHHVLEAALRPLVGVRDWPAAFLASAGNGAEALLEQLQGRWAADRDGWLAELRDLPRGQWNQAAQELEALLPNLAQALLGDALAAGPTKYEVAFLFPALLDMEAAARKQSLPLQEGWTRTILSLEAQVGPVALELGGGRSLAVAGKIDRLEHWEHTEGHMFLRVVDYKVSRQDSLKAYAEPGAPFGAHLQTPVYMLLAEAAFATPCSAVLLPLREAAPDPFTEHLRALVQGAGEGSWRDRLLGNLAVFDDRLEAGDFPPTPGGHCRWCQLSALCGRPVDVDSAEEGD